MGHLLYSGTYERDYPRNALTIAALRRAGYSVDELHRPLWAPHDDKLRGLRPSAAFRLAIKLSLVYAGLWLALAKHLRGADALVIGYIGQADMLALAPVARLAGVPVIFNPLVTLTDTLVEDRDLVRPGSLAARLIGVVDRLSLRLANLILTDTQENTRYLVERFGVSMSRVRVLPVGADERIFTPDPRPSTEVAATARPLRVLFYGTMIPLHGAESIVRAAALLGDEARFQIVGGGQTLASVRALAASLQLRNVEFIDRIPYAELPQRIAASDVVLGIFGATAKAERVVPNKVYQAMALGAAIVTRDSPAIREALADGESALLVPPADPEALASAIRQMADPTLRRRLGAGARAAFESRFSLDALASTLRLDLEDVLVVGAGEPSSVRLSGSAE